MKLKKLISLCLCGIMLFCLGACGAEEQQSPSTLNGKSDEEIITQLLAGYKGLDLPAVSYNVSAQYSMAGTKVSSSAFVSVVGETCAVASETEVDGVSVPYSFVYVDGILYVNALGVRVKGAADFSEADLALQQQIPFELKDTGLFSSRTLLRSENGEYRVVLSEPTSDITSLLNLSAALKSQETEKNEPQIPSEGEEEDPSIETEEDPSIETEEDRLLRTGDFYVTLAFAPQGTLMGMTVGGNVTVLSGGVEAQLTFEVKFTDVKTEGVVVSAPADAAEYTEADPEPDIPATEEPDNSDATEDVEGAE